MKINYRFVYINILYNSINQNAKNQRTFIKVIIEIIDI